MRKFIAVLFTALMFITVSPVKAQYVDDPRIGISMQV